MAYQSVGVDWSGCLQVTDVKHDATALGNDANKGKSGLTGAGQDVAHGNVKNAGQDLTKGKDTMKTTEGDFTKGKSDIGGATKYVASSPLCSCHLIS